MQGINRGSTYPTSVKWEPQPVFPTQEIFLFVLMKTMRFAHLWMSSSPYQKALLETKIIYMHAVVKHTVHTYMSAYFLVMKCEHLFYPFSFLSQSNHQPCDVI